MKIIYTSLVAFVLFTSSAVKAQNYMPNISKDSLDILKSRVSSIKTTLKIYELKIKESEEENDVEKLRVKLLASNAKAKESATQNSEFSKKIASGTLEAKAIEKSAKKANDDMSASQKALDTYHKQIKKVEGIRSDIRDQEQKLAATKPIITFNYK